MKLYTRTGDQGQTSLHGGTRVDKDCLRVEAYGTVDELNSWIGWTRTECDDDSLSTILDTIQRELFELGADLAGDSHTKPRIDDHHIADLERHIDHMCAALPQMKHFILPGGSPLAARMHVARTVCRRAERLCVRLARQQAVDPRAVIYLNRLSDLLFAMARRANQLAGVNDVPWKGA
jgi:cob(I)alamin adenosyltransferase